MRERLPKDVYFELKETIRNGKDLDIDIANAVAHAMKQWALERERLTILIGSNQ